MERFKDAWGEECDRPVKCWECGGSGVTYGETCLTCGGMGELCDPHDRDMDDPEPSGPAG